MVSRGLFLCGLLLGGPSSVWASDHPMMCEASRGGTAPPMPATRSVRTSQPEPRLAELLGLGISRSSAFRELVEALDASDVIVYVSFASNPKLRSYLPHDVVAAGAHRYLRVVLNIKLTDREVIPVLAHELQHAWEVAQARDVGDAAGMITLFNRIGYPVLKGTQVRETDAALHVQQRVRAELASSDRCRD